MHNGANGIVTKYGYDDEVIIKPNMRETTGCFPNGDSPIPLYAYNAVGRGSEPTSITIPSNEYFISKCYA